VSENEIDYASRTILPVTLQPSITSEISKPRRSKRLNTTGAFNQCHNDQAGLSQAGLSQVEKKNRVKAGLDIGTNGFGVPEQNVLPPSAWSC
jgi:hypothetical protein